jgi:glycosyltransferase involved in cell wall biosynthesis
MGKLDKRQILVLVDNPCDPDPRVLREATTLASGGADVIILAWQRDSSNTRTTRQNGVLVRRLPPPSRRRLGWRQMVYLLGFYREVWSAVSDHSRPNVVIAHDFLLLPLGAMLARRFDCPLVYDAHEIYRWMDAGRLPDWWLRFAGWLEARLVNQAVSLFVTVSRQRVEDYFRERMHLDPFILGNWYDPVEIDKRWARRKYEIEPDSSFHIGYVGSLFTSRRVDLLLELAAARQDIQLILGGRGDPRLVSSVEKSAAKMRNVHYLGWVSKPAEVLAACDAIYYVLDPSHPYSRFAAPNALYLAISLDRPLIAAPLGEISMVAKRANAVVELDELTVQGLSRAVDRARRAQSWGQIRSEYNWNLAAEQYARAIAALVD